MRKRLLSALLALCLMLSLVPTAWAADPDAGGGGDGATTADPDTPTTPSNAGMCGDVVWEFVESTKTLTISGNGEMADYESDTEIPWAHVRDKIDTVIIGAGVTKLGQLAFVSSNVKTLYFLGTKEQWDAIYQEAGNTGLPPVTYGCKITYESSATQTDQAVEVVVARSESGAVILPDLTSNRPAGQDPADRNDNAHATSTNPVINFTVPLYSVSDANGNVTYKDMTFTGWLIDGQVYPPDYAYSFPGDTTLTTQWDEAKGGPFKLYYREVYNGVEEQRTLNRDFSYSDEDQVLLFGHEKKGYTFLGWSIGNSTTYSQDLIIPGETANSVYNYKANWRGLSIPIEIFDDKGTPAQFTYTVNPREQTVTVDVPTKNGALWKFKDFDPPITEITFTDATLEAPGKASITIAGDYSEPIQLWGEWVPNTYDITWNADGGTWGQDADGKEVTTQKSQYDFKEDGDQPAELPDDAVGNSVGAPTRTGYTFAGWESDNDKVTCKQDETTKKYVVTIGAGTYGDLNLTAQWEEIKYKVTWNPGDGYWTKAEDGTLDQRPKESTYTIENKTLTQVEPKRDDHVFRGWKYTKDGVDIVLEHPEGDYTTFTVPEDYLDDLELTPVWVAEYTITLEPNNRVEGEEPETIKVAENEKFVLPKCSFTTPDASKTFIGWKLTVSTAAATPAPDENGNYPDGTEFDVTEDMTFTAQWGDVKYTITIDPNNGAEKIPVSVVHGQPYTLLEATSAPPDGYDITPPAGKEFECWKVEGLPRPYYPGDSLPQVQQEYTIIAQWKNIEYRVTFDKNDPYATGEMEAIEHLVYDDVVTLPGCGFEYPDPNPDDPDAPPEKLIFVAWDIDGKEYAPGATIEIKGNIEAKAVWLSENDVTTYIINFLPGGGDGTMDPMEVTVRKGGAGVTVALPTKEENKFTFDDMTFAGWYAGTNPAVVDPGATILLSTETMDVTAVWHGEIKFVDAEGVTGPDHYVYDANKGSNLAIQGTPVKPGHKFQGWDLGDAKDQVIIFNDNLIDIPKDFKGTLTITAKWDINEDVYLVNYDANGGTGTMASVEVPKAADGEETKHTLLPNGFTPPAGMEFDCWLVDGQEYKAGDEIVLTKTPTTVQAKWKEQDIDPDAPDYTVTFDPGEGGTGTMEPAPVKGGQWYDLPACTFTPPEGKEFDAWSMDGERRDPGYRFLIEGDVTVTALWKDKEPEPDDPNKPKVWTITFDANGGTGTMASIEVSQVEGGVTYTLPACAFTAPEGKVFQAWQAGAEERNPGTTITVTGDITIKALWKDAPTKPAEQTNFKITYNLNGGYMTGTGPSSYNVSSEAQTINVPVPYKNGYTFLGWTYSGVSKPTKTITIRANMRGDLTVVANWQINPGTGTGVNGSPEQGNYIAVSTTAGGEIRIPYTYAVENATVTFQAQPQTGFAVGEVSVTNSQGWEVGNLRDLGGGSYSFTMPNYRVNISATFVAQSAAASPISKPVMNYSDVRLGDWYYNSVEYVYNRGMMSGVSATQFGPNGEASRGVIWTALAAHAGFDVSGGATWYERGQYWAMNRGITDGASPSGAITREQLVTMLWRYKGNPAAFGGDLGQFADGYTVSSYALDAMRWAVSTGLMGGANGYLNPQATTTRAEAATILARFCQNM